MDLCRALAEGQLPADCAVCVAAEHSIHLAPANQAREYVLPIRSPLPNFLGGAQQLRLEAPEVSLFHAGHPRSTQLMFCEPGAALAKYLSWVPGLKRVSILAPVVIGAQHDRMTYVINDCPDVQSLVAVLKSSDTLHSMINEQDCAVVEYLGCAQPSRYDAYM